MMKIYKLLGLIGLTIGWMLLSIAGAYAEAPITTDSRIKTYVYNENEVYPIVVHYGYQSSIEFSLGEEAEVTSLGDSYSWKITRVGRRLFIKTQEANAHTNLTVITNKHTYQFDLYSKLPDEHLDEELVYVVRFFYPNANRQFDRVIAPAATVPAIPTNPTVPSYSNLMPPVPGH